MSKKKSSQIRNEISLAGVKFSLTIKTDEALAKAVEVFEKMADKYMRR